METTAPAVTGSAAAAALELSPTALFLAADPVVKGVMALLAVASVACWAIILDKTVRIAGLRRQARRFEAVVAARASDGLQGLSGELFAAGLAEESDRDARESRAERRERIERSMRETVRRHLRRRCPRHDSG